MKKVLLAMAFLALAAGSSAMAHPGDGWRPGPPPGHGGGWNPGHDGGQGGGWNPGPHR